MGEESRSPVGTLRRRRVATAVKSRGPQQLLTVLGAIRQGAKLSAGTDFRPDAKSQEQGAAAIQIAVAETTANPQHVRIVESRSTSDTYQVHSVIPLSDAAKLVGDVLGSDWSDRVRIETDTPLRAELRMRHLAHSIKAFESAIGFPEYIRKLKSRRILQAVSELFAATNFFQAGFEVAFNHGAEKGDDFDLLAKSPFFDVAVEVKTAGLEADSRMDYLETYKKAVKGARTQLPRDGLNAVFLLVPQDVLCSDKLGWAVKNAIIDDALRQTTRIHTVIFGCEMINEEVQRYGLSNTAFPHAKSNNVRRGCEIAWLLRKVPSFEISDVPGRLQQLDLVDEMRQMPTKFRLN